MPETTFTEFYVSDYLKSFDSETDYIGLMITDLKYKNKWYHDGRKHHFVSYSKPNGRNRQKRSAIKNQSSWDQLLALAASWTKRNQATTSYRTTPRTTPYKTTPRPLEIETGTFRNTLAVTEGSYRTRRPNRRPTRPSRRPTSEPETPKLIPTERTRPSRRPASEPETSKLIPTVMPTTYTAPTTPFTTGALHSTTVPSTTAKSRILTKRVKPGTIVMMNSTYLKEKYISTNLATTFHSALLMDYFELSEAEMKEIGMTVVAWGFSYQVKDTKQHGKYYCDFKFRSATFNAGYIGADIDLGIVQYNG